MICTTPGCNKQTQDDAHQCPVCLMTGAPNKQFGRRQVDQIRVTSIESTLAERGARYGKFEDHAVIAQGLQDVMRAAPGWNRMAADQKQAVSVIADKIARMLNGDPDYLDNWHDIIGYAKLVEDRLKKQ